MKTYLKCSSRLILQSLTWFSSTPDATELHRNSMRQKPNPKFPGEFAQSLAPLDSDPGSIDIPSPYVYIHKDTTYVHRSDSKPVALFGKNFVQTVTISYPVLEIKSFWSPSDVAESTILDLRAWGSAKTRLGALLKTIHVPRLLRDRQPGSQWVGERERGRGEEKKKKKPLLWTDTRLEFWPAKSQWRIATLGFRRLPLSASVYCFFEDGQRSCCHCCCCWFGASTTKHIKVGTHQQLCLSRGTSRKKHLHASFTFSRPFVCRFCLFCVAF